MRVPAVFAVVALCVLSCGGPPGPSSIAESTPSAAPVNPVRIDRVRGDLPDGYEVADAVGAMSPAAFWGLGENWTADPPQCGALADPVVDGDAARGWSGSGAGGTVHAAVAPGRPLAQALLSECGQWTVAGGRTSGSVTFAPAPAIDGASTVAMTTATTTVVEGGTEIHSHADTITSYLGDYVAFVTVVTDPGSPNPQLGADFAAALMVKTVSALRG